MKICWDTLEGVHLSRNGTFRKGEHSYVYMESCSRCGQPYLATSSIPSIFCSISCANKGRFISEKHRKNLSVANMGRVTSSETAKKISMSNMGRAVSSETRRRLSISHTGKIFSEEHRKNLSIANTGKVLSVETKKKISKNNVRRIGFSNHSWKGGVKALGITTYDTQRDKLKPYEEIRKQKGTEALEVRCTYCNKWFTPTYKAVRSRLDAINNLNKGEQRFYCSENCKQVCPTYQKKIYPKGFKHTTSREVSTQLRQMVFERDNWICQICGKTTKEIQLHCHHMDPVAQIPMFQNDIDSCITLCKDCHKMVHSRKGCRYVDLQCKEKVVTQYTVKGCGVS